MAEKKVQVPELPQSLSAAVVQRRFEKLLKVTDQYVDQSLTGDAFMLFTHAVHAKLPGTSLSAVTSSLNHLAGIVINRHTMTRTMRLLAGNTRRLEKGVAIADTTWRNSHNWAAGEIHNVVEAPFKPEYGTRWDLMIDILSGPSVGLRAAKTVQDNVAKFLGPRLGFSKPYKDRPIVHATELSGLRVAVYLSPGRNEATAPNVVAVQVTNAMLTYNRKLVSKRNRVDYKCPKGYPIETVPCYRCPMGRDRCPVSLHPITLVRVKCDRGGCDKQFWHDPDVNSTVKLCANCKRSKVAVNEAPPCRPK